MDKQMIEEMVELMANWAVQNNMLWHEGHAQALAETFAENDYGKIPEGAVVLTKEEWRNLNKNYEILKLELKEARKETAEKFAKRLKAKLNEWLEDNEDNDGKIDFGVAQIELIGVKSLEGEVIAESLIDEICEEIIGGADDDTSQVGK